MKFIPLLFIIAILSLSFLQSSYADEDYDEDDGYFEDEFDPTRTEEEYHQESNMK